MKYILYITLFITLISCSTDSKNNYEKLIDDPLYQQQFKLSLSNSSLISNKKINVKEVYQKINSYTSEINYCDKIHYEKFKDQHFVKQFFQNHCNLVSISSKLKSKYLFYAKLSTEDFRDINDLYIEKYWNGISYNDLINKLNRND